MIRPYNFSAAGSGFVKSVLKCDDPSGTINKRFFGFCMRPNR